jgi:hypothetical protein
MNNIFIELDIIKNKLIDVIEKRVNLDLPLIPFVADNIDILINDFFEDITNLSTNIDDIDTLLDYNADKNNDPNSALEINPNVKDRIREMQFRNEVLKTVSPYVLYLTIMAQQQSQQHSGKCPICKKKFKGDHIKHRIRQHQKDKHKPKH